MDDLVLLTLFSTLFIIGHIRNRSHEYQDFPQYEDSEFTGRGYRRLYRPFRMCCDGTDGCTAKSRAACRARAVTSGDCCTLTPRESHGGAVLFHVDRAYPGSSYRRTGRVYFRSQYVFDCAGVHQQPVLLRDHPKADCRHSEAGPVLLYSGELRVHLADTVQQLSLLTSFTAADLLRLFLRVHPTEAQSLRVKENLQDV